MKYRVFTREVHTSCKEVEANSADDAILLVERGDGEFLYSEYDYTLDDPPEAKVVEVESLNVE